MAKCAYCGSLIRDDESTCDSQYCGPEKETPKEDYITLKVRDGKVVGVKENNS